MATSILTPLDEYLRTSYQPDCDWVEGDLRERNMGEGPHVTVQAFLIAWFYQRRHEFQVRVMPEQRVQTSISHFRVPDVSVARANAPFQRIVTVPPLLCIEILSWDDRMSEIQERVADYFSMGVIAVWVIDPKHRTTFSAGADGSLLAVSSDLVVEGTAISLPVTEIFADLNHLEGRV